MHSVHNSKKQLGTNEPTEQLIPIKLQNLPKFTEISSHCLTHISLAKAVNNNCYVWGECKDSVINTPKETQIQSIDKAFFEYSKNNNTFKPVFLSKYKYICESLNEEFIDLSKKVSLMSNNCKEILIFDNFKSNLLTNNS